MHASDMMGNETTHGIHGYHRHPYIMDNNDIMHLIFIIVGIDVIEIIDMKIIDVMHIYLWHFCMYRMHIPRFMVIMVI
jgi:hypothetical protein